MAKQAQRLPQHGHAIARKWQDEAEPACDRAEPLDPRVILQRFARAPQSLRPADILRLQQTHGNRFVQRLLSQSAENRTGLPDKLKAGIEMLSGHSMDDVCVHYNSPKPADLDALAYTQGTDIHVAPGQERHLPHEAWHVVQQRQGRVRPAFLLNGEEINDDQGLEHEADVMGARSMRMRPHDDTAIRPSEQQDGNGEEFQLPANLSVARIMHGSRPRVGVVVPKLGVAQLMPKPKPPKPMPDARNKKLFAEWQSESTKYNNYVEFCKEVASYNEKNKTNAVADNIWTRNDVTSLTEARTALKKVKPPTQPVVTTKTEPTEYSTVTTADQPNVPDEVKFNATAYRHAADGWAGTMMKKGSVAVTSDEIKNYIEEFIIKHGFLSKAAPNTTRARTWPTKEKCYNDSPNLGGTRSSVCTIAYEWQDDHWYVWHFGPSGEFSSRIAIFDVSQ